MKNVQLQDKNLNIVAEHYKYSNIKKIITTDPNAIGIIILFLSIFCFKFNKIFFSIVILSPISIFFVKPVFLPIERNFSLR